MGMIKPYFLCKESSMKQQVKLHSDPLFLLEKIFLCWLQLQLHAFLVLSVTGHENTGSQSQMGRFMSIYAEKLLGIFSTVLLNAKNDFGHQQSKIRCDISFGLM